MKRFFKENAVFLVLACAFTILGLVKVSHAHAADETNYKFDCWNKRYLVTVENGRVTEYTSSYEQKSLLKTHAMARVRDTRLAVFIDLYERPDSQQRLVLGIYKGDLSGISYWEDFNPFEARWVREAGVRAPVFQCRPV